MAVLQGIQGMNMTGGASGGNIALSIQTRILRILADMDLSYLFAKPYDATGIKNGTVTYYTPEIVSAKDYGDGTSPFKKIGAGLTSFNLDIRRTEKYEYEEFDYSRLEEAGGIVGMIASGVAMAIQADLNAYYIEFLTKQFDKTSGKLKDQKIELQDLGAGDPHMTPDQAYADYEVLEYKLQELGTTFDKRHLGIDIAEFYCILSPKCNVGLRKAFRHQPNSLGDWQIAKTLVGKQVGNIHFTTDKMLDKSIGADKSFREEAFDTTGVWGFMLHTEAVAMPINLMSVKQLENPENGNPRFIYKYQFGCGILRPNLVWIILKTGTEIEGTKAVPKAA